MPGLLAPTTETPMAYLFGDGHMARDIAPLLQALLVVGLVVSILVSLLVLVGVLLRRARTPLPETPIGGASGEAWISIGVGVSTLVLIGLVVWSTVTMAKISRPPEKPDLTVAITAHRWWWEATYVTGDLSQTFATANEIHIPVGKSVRFTLYSPDVIHSFWAPALGGKTDVIPGQTNVTWLKAQHVGSYRGQCAEYCGKQHAHMAFAVIADKPQVFADWLAAQAKPAAAPQGEAAQEGQAVFLRHCAVCHAVRGTGAGGRVGPDLTHLMTRHTLAAGTIPNNPGWLSAWVADPQHIKPGSLMPDMRLSGAELASLRAYLQTLD